MSSHVTEPNNNDTDMHLQVVVPETGRCVVCLEELAFGAKVCPKCQRDQSPVIRNINRLGGVVAVLGLILTFVAAYSAYKSAREASQERVAAEAALEKSEIIEARVDLMAESVSAQALAIQVQARSFYQSQMSNLRELFQSSFGSCQVGPEITCYLYYRQAMKIANLIFAESDSEFFKAADADSSITFIVCNYVREMKDRSISTIEHEGEGKVMADQTLQDTTQFQEIYCEV